VIVTVHFHTILQRQTPEGRVTHAEIDLPDGSTLADLLDGLALPLGGDDLLLVINGRTVTPDHTLAPGDKIDLIPAISGG
jgi:sulfur carrier protein ThiS